MKLCRKCGLNKELTAFSRKSRNPDGLQSSCKSCHNAYGKRHYEDNRQYYVDKAGVRNKAAIDNNRIRMWEYLHGHPCVDCGESDPIVLEFDHILGVKTGNVSYLAYAGYSWSRVAKEIEKCVVRCANCHRRKTAIQFGWRVSAGQFGYTGPNKV